MSKKEFHWFVLCALVIGAIMGWVVTIDASPDAKRECIVGLPLFFMAVISFEVADFNRDEIDKRH